MIDRDSLIDAMQELEKEPFTFNKCEKLACVYTIYDHLFEPKKEVPPEIVKVVNDSEFSKSINQKSIDDIILIFDELMRTLEAIQPNLYSAVISKIKKL